MADFPIDEAQIVALFLETMFYGIYLVSFGMCLHALLPRGRIKSGQHSLLVVTLLLFVFATLDEALIVRHVLEAFIWYKGNGGARAEFADISNWVNGMKTVSYTAQTGLGDGILIYRCFVIYGHNWAIAMGLCLLYISGLVCATIVCYIEFTMHQSALLNATRLTPFMIAALCLTLFLNIIATSLIFHKIRSIQRQSARLFVDIKGGGGALPHAVRIVTESGAMYTISVAVLLVVSCTGSSAQYGVSDCIVQVIGIAFNLIIIRVGRGQTTEFMVAKHDMSGHVVDSQNRGNSSASGEAIPLHLAKGGSTIRNITFLDDDPMRLADVVSPVYLERTGHCTPTHADV